MLTCPTERVAGVKRGLQSESPQLDRTEADHLELEARTASPMPSREALVDCSKVSLNGDVQDPEHIDLGQEKVSKVVRNPLQNHNRMDSGRRYYSEDSQLDSVSVTLVSTSKVSTAREGQGRVQEGTFDHCLDQKITLSKLSDDSITNDLWIWLPDAYRYVDSRYSMDALEKEIDKNLSNGFWGVWFY